MKIESAFKPQTIAVGASEIRGWSLVIDNPLQVSGKYVPITPRQGAFAPLLPFASEVPEQVRTTAILLGWPC
jgi:hypothetical protein